MNVPELVLVVCVMYQMKYFW